MRHTDKHGLIWETDLKELGTDRFVYIYDHARWPGLDLHGLDLDDGLIRGAAGMLERHAKASKHEDVERSHE